MDRKVTTPVPHQRGHPTSVQDGPRALEQQGTLSVIFKKIAIRLKGLGFVFRMSMLSTTSERKSIDKQEGTDT